MTSEEMLAALAEVLAVQSDPEGYYTAQEIAEIMGLGKVAVQKRLKVAQSVGRLGVAKVKRQAIDGRMMHTPAYRILPG